MSKYINYNSNEMNKWANETLTTEELSQYQSAVEANNLLWKSYQDQGLYTIEDLYETIYSETLDANIEVVVGNKITMAPGVNLYSLELDSNYNDWVNRFNAEAGNLLPGAIQVE